MVNFLKEYTPRIDCKLVYWKNPKLGMYKCNLDGAARGNLRTSSTTFCVRNESGDLIYAEQRKLEDNSKLIIEVIDFRMGLDYCI